MKLLVSGDWHIGAGAEYGRKPGDRLRDQANVCQRISVLAAERNVDGVLLAGDLFNGPTATPEHLAVLANFVLECPCPVLTITGNGMHDLAMRDVNGLAIFAHIPGITVSSIPDVYPFAGCAVATLPWVSPSRLVASRNGGDRDEINADVARMLVEVARGAKGDCVRVAPHGPHVLLAHWSVTGSALPNGLPVDQLREPVLPLAELEQLGFDAVVLGHIHQEQLLATDPADPVIPIFYVGSPLPLNFGEARARHGVWILEFVEGVGAMVLEFVPVASPAFVTLDLDPEDLGGDVAKLAGQDGQEPISEGSIVRVRYRATREQESFIDKQWLRQSILDAGAATVKIVPDIVRDDRARVAGLDEQVDELDALDRWLVAQGIDGVDEPWALAEPTRVLAERMRSKARGYLEAVR